MIILILRKKLYNLLRCVFARIFFTTGFRQSMKRQKCCFIMKMTMNILCRVLFDTAQIYTHDIKFISETMIWMNGECYFSFALCTMIHHRHHISCIPAKTTHHLLNASRLCQQNDYLASGIPELHARMGVFWFHSLRPSVRPPHMPCPLVSRCLFRCMPYGMT